MELNLGHTIIVRRAVLNISRKQAAEAAGLSYPYWSELEAGTKNPSWDSLVAVAKALRFESLSDFALYAERVAAEHHALTNK